MGTDAFRIGVDVGGTFTDLALVSPDGSVVHHKIPSTPAQPADAIAVGVTELLAVAGVGADAVGYLGHGTTVATNQLIERRGARTALVTTRGFRDVLEIARQTRPHLYDYREHRAAPLAPRRLRFELDERIGADGEVLRPLERDALAGLVDALAEAEVAAVAICLLHAYRNPVHERMVRDLLAVELPGVYACASSDVLPEFREFERTATTVANAYLGPTMDRYLGRFSERLDEIGVRVEPYTFHSNGGLMSLALARRFPVRTCLSGPAAGVMGVAALAAERGEGGVVAFDVGGTSTDVALIADGRIAYATERLVAGFPIKAPTLDVHVIGAGGGSIAWIDAGGALKVGPRSAGAEPGPAAYGRGGSEPTLTDANVVLGRLNPNALLDGGLPLDAAGAARAVEAGVASRLGGGVEAAADGIVRVAVANIARAIRSASVERGHDPRTFALVAYGGAGPVLAAAVAREVGCARVLVPIAPGAMCARGILVSDRSIDYVRTCGRVAAGESWEEAAGLFAAMEVEAASWFAHERLAPPRCRRRWVIDSRYVGQGFELPVELAGPPDTASAGLDSFMERFAAAHEAHYGYALPGRGVEIVNCRLQAIGKTGVRLAAAASEGPSGKPESRRDVFFGEASGWLSTPVLRRASLAAGTSRPGPLVIEELTSTTVVFPRDRLAVDPGGNLVIDIEAQA